MQTFINVGVNMGVLPTKGLTLPFLSFGGSGIVANCVALAILLDRLGKPPPAAGVRRMSVAKVLAAVVIPQPRAIVEHEVKLACVEAN